MVLTSYIVLQTTPESRREKHLCRLILISDQHDGSLLRDHPLFAGVQIGPNDAGTEVEIMENNVLECTNTEKRHSTAKLSGS